MKYVFRVDASLIGRGNLLSKEQINSLFDVEDALINCTTLEEAREAQKIAPDANFQHKICGDVTYVVLISHFLPNSDKLM